MSEHANPPEILTVADVANYLRVSETTVWRWCISGKIPAFRIGRGWRVRRSELDRLLGQVPHLPDGSAGVVEGRYRDE